MTQPAAAPRLPGLLTGTDLKPVLAAALVLALHAPLGALAAEPDASAVTITPLAQPLATDEWQLERKRQVTETGQATRNWLQAQGGRELASASRPTLSGPALRRVHDRYLKSFEVEIPQQLRESLPGNK